MFRAHIVKVQGFIGGGGRGHLPPPHPLLEASCSLLGTVTIHIICTIYMYMYTHTNAVTISFAHINEFSLALRSAWEMAISLLSPADKLSCITIVSQVSTHKCSQITRDFGPHGHLTEIQIL